MTLWSLLRFPVVVYYSLWIRTLVRSLFMGCAHTECSRNTLLRGESEREHTRHYHMCIKSTCAQQHRKIGPHPTRAAVIHENEQI